LLGRSGGPDPGPARRSAGRADHIEGPSTHRAADACSARVGRRAGGSLDSQPNETTPAIRRLLFVADAAVAEVSELPSRVRAVIDAAAELYVLTPTLPGRLAWLADDVDRCRHVADERLDTVLGHMRAIGARASGDALRGSVLTVFADAVADFQPDHILVALRSSEHANWQERGLIEHVKERFGLPLTAFAIDPEGRVSTAPNPGSTSSG
jgi:hypothetical protein